MVPGTELTVKVLGPLEVWSADTVIDVGGPRPRSLLALLVAARGEVVSTDRLIEELWGGTAPREARRTIQSYVSSIRRAMGGPVAPLVSVGPGYVVDAERVRVDVEQFEQLLESARERLASRRWVNALEDTAAALGCWRGDAFADLPVDDIDALAVERQRLHDLRDVATDVRIDALLALGRGRELVPELERAVTRRPERETSWQQLAIAQHAAGRTVEALRTIDRLRRHLAEEYGLAPSTTTQAIEQRLLAGDQDPGPGPPERITARTDAPCPYLGLAPYTQADAGRFFGRDALVSVLLARLVDHHLVVVAGPSGVGKSSLVRAGVVPALERGAIPGAGWSTTVIDAALVTTADWRSLSPRTGRRRLVVVDQFEIVLGRLPLERDRIIDGLLSTIQPEPSGDVRDRLVVVVRGDAYGELAGHRRLATLAGAATVLVGPMTEEELREAVVGPARTAGLDVEPALVDAVVADAGGHPGALPLVSHALVETWTRREGITLTHQAYQATGGVAGALAQRAEQTLGGLDPAQTALARDLLLRLLDVRSDGVEPRRMPAPEQCRWSASDLHASVIDALATARLITVGDHGIALTHAAVLDAWPRLRNWVHESREQLQVRQQITADAARWDRQGRSEHDLLHGPRLAAAVEWPDEALPLGALEQEYVAASLEAAEVVRRRLADEVERERRTNRRLRLLATATLAGVFGASALGAVAVRQRQRADELAQIAVARQLATESSSRLDDDLALALLLAAEAVQMSDRAETRRALAAALQQQPELRRLSASNPGPWATMAISADGSTAAMLPAAGGEVQIHSATADAGVVTFRSTDVDAAARLAAAPDGSVVAAQRSDGTVVVFDRHDERIARVIAAGSSGGAIAFSPDGRRLAVASGAGHDGATAGVRVFDVGTGDPLGPTIDLGDTTPAAVAVATDGSVAVVDVDGLIRIHDLGGQMRASWVGPLMPHSIAVDATGDRVAVGGFDQIEVRDLASDERRAFSPSRSPVHDLAFTSDGRLVAAAGNGWTLWDAALTPVRSVTVDAEVVGLGTDGADLTVIERSGRVTRWSLDEWPVIAAPTRTAAVVAVSADGRLAAVADGTSAVVEVTRLDTADGAAAQSSEPVPFTTDRVSHLQWSHDGGHLAAASTAGEIVVREVGSDGDVGNVVAVTELPTPAFPAVTADGRLLAAVGADGTVRMVPIGDADEVPTPEIRLDARPTVAAFDGATLIVGDDRGGLTAIDADTGAVQRRQLSGRAVTALHVDRRLFAGTADGEVHQVEWDQDRTTVVFDTGDAAVRGLDVAPDRRWVAAVTELGRTHLADRESGVDGPVFGPGGNVVTEPHAIVLGTEWLHVWDGATLVRWDVDVDTWQAMACDIAGRSLSTLERRRHLPANQGAPACPG